MSEARYLRENMLVLLISTALCYRTKHFKGHSKDNILLYKERQCLLSLFTLLRASRGFKELDSQVLYGEYGGVSLLLPLFILLPQALHTTGTQALCLQRDLMGLKGTAGQMYSICTSQVKRFIEFLEICENQTAPQ